MIFWYPNILKCYDYRLTQCLPKTGLCLRTIYWYPIFRVYENTAKLGLNELSYNGLDYDEQNSAMKANVNSK